MWHCETATDAGAEVAAYKLLPGGPRVRNEGYKTPEVIYNPVALFARLLSICHYQFTGLPTWPMFNFHLHVLPHVILSIEIPFGKCYTLMLTS